MYKKLFGLTKKLIPRISDTELIALRSGTTSLDRGIFMGKVKYPKYQMNKKTHKATHQSSIHTQTNN